MSVRAPLVEFRGVPPLMPLTVRVTEGLAALIDRLDQATCHVLIHRPAWSVEAPFDVETRVAIASCGRPKVVVSEIRRVPACTEDVLIGTLQPTVTRVLDAVARHLATARLAEDTGSPTPQSGS